MTKLLHDVHSATYGGIYTWGRIPVTNDGNHLSWMGQADPLLYLALHYSRDLRAYSKAVVVRSGLSSRRTATAPRHDMYYNLALFLDTLSVTNTNARGIPQGNWKPYTRLTKRGIASEKDCATEQTFGLYDSYGSWRTNYGTGDIVDHAVNMPIVGPDSVPICNFDTIHGLASSMLDAYGDSPGFYRIIDNRSYASFYYDLTVNNDEVSYRLWNRYFWSPYSSANGWLWEGNISYVRRSDFLNQLEIHVTGNLGSRRVISWVTQPTYYGAGQLPPSVSDYSIITSVDTQADIQQLSDDRRQTILSASPILFYTQSRALSALFGDLSANFESLVELPEMRDLAFTLFELLNDQNAASNFISKAIPDRIEFMLKAIIGGYFAYSFAIKPSLELIPSIIEAFQDSMNSKVESTTKIEGDANELLTLDPELQDFILSGIDIDTVKSFTATFHTEITPDIRKEYVTYVLTDLYTQLGRFQFQPSVTDMWNLMRLTFVVNWFLPMDQYIKAAENFVQSYRSSIGSIGHSISIEIVTCDNLYHNTYVRSDNSTLPLRPPRTSWIQPPGAPPTTAIPLAIIMGLGFGSRVS